MNRQDIWKKQISDYNRTQYNADYTFNTSDLVSDY